MMGISVQTWEFLQESLAELPRVGRVCELGNQHIRPAVGLNFKQLDPSWRRGKPFAAKKWFEHRGWEHVSIDINGRDGALALDLSRPLPSHLGTFQLVTNFGTSEHVHDQYECFHNIDRLCAVSGLMVHAVPMLGHWIGHSEHGFYYTVSSFDSLARQNGYGVIRLSVVPYPGRSDQDLIVASLRKLSAGPFESRAGFDERIICDNRRRDKQLRKDGRPSVDTRRV